MVDLLPSPPPPQSSFAKKIMVIFSSGAGLEVIQHLSPMLAKYLIRTYGIDENFASELVDLGWTLAGAAVVGLATFNFVQFVTDLILGWRRAWKKWRDAANQPLNGDK